MTSMHLRAPAAVLLILALVAGTAVASGLDWQCGSKALAYRFATTRLQPERDWSSGAGAALAGGLQVALGPDGRVVNCTGPAPPPPPPPPVPPPPMPPKGQCSQPVDKINLVSGYPHTKGVVLASDSMETAAACQALCEKNSTCYA